MDIFFASQSFYPYVGGVSTYVLNLARGLKQRGNDVKVFHLRPPGQPTEAVVHDIKVFRLPKEPIVTDVLKGYSHFKERIYCECHGQGELFEKEPLSTDGYDDYHTINQLIGKEIEGLLKTMPMEIVHIHDFQLLLIYKHIPRGIPLILTWHIPFPNILSMHLREFLVRHMNEFDRIIFSTKEYALAAIAAGIEASKVRIIHPLVNTALFKPRKEEEGMAIRALHNIGKDTPLILCAQRIDWKSGHLQLIQAMPRVLELVPGAKLAFVGMSSMSNKISNERENLEKEVHEAIKKYGLEHHVLFLGNVEYEHMPAYYQAADVVSLLSKSEGFGLAISEAMACAKPVIGTAVSGIALQIKDGVNGFLVGVGDVEQTAQRLVELLKDPVLRSRMGQEGRKIVKAEFSSLRGIDAHHQLYKKILKEKTDLRVETLRLEDVSALILDGPLLDPKNPTDSAIIEGLISLKKPIIMTTSATLRDIDVIKNLYYMVECVIAQSGEIIYLPQQNVTMSIAPLDKKNQKKPIITKVSSLKLALHHLGLDAEKILIISDDTHDAGVFQMSGYKIAVANATSEMKLLADETTKKESSKGILEVIDKLRNR